jgi:tight adherence protein B
MNDILSAVLVALLVSIVVATILIALVNANFQTKKEHRLDKVLASYARVVGAGEAAEIAATQKRQVRSQVFQKFEKSIDEKLAGAGLEVTASVWIWSSLGASAVAFVVGLLGVGSPVIGALLGLLAGFYMLNVFLASRIRSRAIKFAMELPSLLQIVASGLRSGLTFDAALSATAAQDKGEVGRQFRRAIAEVQFGSTLEDALRRVAARMSSDDLNWLVMVLEIQREMGGSLSGILDGVAATIKGRAEVKREIKVISAEGRMSGYVLIALPIFSMISLFVIRPEYVSFFWTNPVGFIMLGGFLLLMAIGWVWMNKVVQVRV